MSGLLLVKPLSAKLRRDTETFGKMDPYCRIRFGSARQQTRVHNNGGKFPAWNDTLTFKKTNESLITIEVWDSDAVNDDLVGECTIPLSKIVQSKKSTEWYTLSYKGRNAGDILIEFDYRADQQSMPQFPVGQPSMMMAGTGAQPFNPIHGVTYMLPQMYMQQQQQPQPMFVQQQQQQPVFVQQQQQPMFVQQQPVYTQPMGQPGFGQASFAQQPTYTQPMGQAMPMSQPTYSQPMGQQPTYNPTMGQQMGQATYGMGQQQMGQNAYGQPQGQQMMQNQMYPQQQQQMMAPQGQQMMAPQGQQISYAPPSGY